MMLRDSPRALRGWRHFVRNYEEQITRGPQICGGEPVFKATRATLRMVLASLASEDSPEQILIDFPGLKAEDVQAAISFAAASAEEDLAVPATPHVAPRVR